MLFCKICGATKSHSRGSNLAQPCRGWAPPGTRATIRARLQGRSYGFFRGLDQSPCQGHNTGQPSASVPTSLPEPTAIHHVSPIRLTRIPVVNAHLSRQGGNPSEAPTNEMYSGSQLVAAPLPKAKRLRLWGKQAPAGD